MLTFAVNAAKSESRPVPFENGGPPPPPARWHTLISDRALFVAALRTDSCEG